MTTTSILVPAVAANSYQGGGVYAALRTQAHCTLEVRGGRINVVFAGDAPGLNRERALRLIRRSADAVSTCFRRFPVDEVGILIVASSGKRVVTGTTYGYGSSPIRMEGDAM